MTLTVAMIACGNGLGHVRRCVLIAEVLVDSGAAVELFAPFWATQRIHHSVGIDGRINTVDFDTETSVETLREGKTRTARWECRLPAFDRYDLVVSDNLPEVLDVRQDTILSGNFLWHHVLPDIAPKIRNRANSLIVKYRPRMITYGPFVGSQLDDLISRLPVTMIQNRRSAIKFKKNALLITCGHSQNLRVETTRLINSVAKGAKPGVGTVFVEPELLPFQAPEWMRAADYSPTMYDQLVGAVIRPGMGTIGDCLASGVRVFAFHEPGNQEMVDNCATIEALELGEYCIDEMDAWRRATDYLRDYKGQIEFFKAVARLDFGGAKIAASHIIDLAQNEPS